MEHQHWLSHFHQRTTDAHLGALLEGSSVYVATETFICESAGETWKFTAYAVLREQYDGVPSPYAGTSHPQAMLNDLDCGLVGVPTTSYPDQLGDWLDGQSLVKHVKPSRAMSAIWDLSRLPVGPHHPSSATFRYLRRSFYSVLTR